MFTPSTQRFSDRVEDYVRFRPGYPEQVVATLQEKWGLKPEHIIVDVGCGTGISSELFLKNGNTVFGVEPNEPMREAAESFLKQYKNFHGIHGTAEVTTLSDRCADVIVAAQAFHWFDPEKTKQEFRRILRKDGLIVILLNHREANGSEFGRQYEELMQEFGADYKQAKHRNGTEKRHQSFLGEYQEDAFPNPQELDFASFVGRVKSSSYAPKEGHPLFQEMLEKIKTIFAQNQKDGTVVVPQTTHVFCSRWEGNCNG